MGRFRKRPIEVEAIQWDVPRMIDDVLYQSMVFDWLGPNPPVEIQEERALVHTLHGPTFAEPGDWIIRGPSGDLWPCKPDIFEATYEPLEDPSDGDG